MRIAKKTAAVLIGSLLAVSVPVSASAFSASITGASASSSGKTVTIKDTAADSKSARAKFEPDYLAPRPTWTLTNSAGNGTTLSKTYAATIVGGQACVVNSNPFDSNKCSAWKN